MSGGVDSSVTAALLKEQGYEVIGMMMRLWSEPGKESENRCCTLDDLNTARSIAAQLDIPFYAIDAKEAFRSTVVQYFIDGYAQGLTPNPCLVCNRKIRWEFLLKRALALGADFMATGHYARLEKNEQGVFQLLKGVDEGKDQCYVLHVLNQEKLAHALFPLGTYTKQQVREMAQRFNLPVASRSDSQDLCFLGSGSYQDFLRRNIPTVINPGAIITSDGDKLGEHQGLAFYTIGQRRGLGITSSQPLYVIEKDISNNALVIGPKNALGKSELNAHHVNWIAGKPPNKPIRAIIKIRYRARGVWGTVTPLESHHIHIQFEESLRDITPGQAAVIYDGDICLGGGIINNLEKSCRKKKNHIASLQ